ncbi:hypothetical protein [Xanthocytophaga flava]|uniref:hypothetical protein n=1 Tax=Xanthocytophaga flava TaxID=3048013 RepID=UPI0028D6AE87|nr:hypothetical protein [Xanthocytophaga flavus]MDJ1472409.1 hypothetical protein [Xanthocytophaga flavus]
MNWEKIGFAFYRYFLKPLLALFGRDDKYYEKSIRRGYEHKFSIIKKYAESKLIEPITNLYLIGYFEGSLESVEKQQKLVEQGKYEPFIESKPFDPFKTYIEIYLIKSISEKYCVAAFGDGYDPEILLQCLWFVEVGKEKLENLNELIEFQSTIPDYPVELSHFVG